MRRLLISLCCLAAGLAGGFLIRRAGVRQEEPPAAAGTRESPPASRLPVSSLSAPGRRVRAWLKSGVVPADHRVELTGLTLRDLQNVEALSGADFPQLLPLALDHPGRQLLMERWAEVDAAGFAAWLEPLARAYDPWEGVWISGYARYPGNRLFIAGLRALVRVDPEAAERLNLYGPRHPGIRPPPPPVQAADLAPAPPPPVAPAPDLTAMSGKDAWVWLRENDRTRELAQVAAPLLSDPERAFVWLEEMPPAAVADAGLLKPVLLELIRGNPQRLITLLGKFGSAQDVAQALHGCSELNSSHWPQIEAWALRNRNAGIRSAAVIWLMEERTAAGLEDALAWAGRLPRSDDRAAALQWLVKEGPEPALMAEQFADNPPPEEESRVLTALTSRWARDDRAAALAWAESLQDGSFRDHAVTGVWQAWTGTEPDAALAAFAHESGDSRRAALQGVVSSWWAREYPRKVLRWITELPAEEQSSALAATGREFSSGLSRELLPVLSGLAAAPVPAEDAAAFYRFIHRVVDRQAGRDAEAVKSWAMKLSAGDVRREALSAIAVRLLDLSWEAGGAWVASLPEADQRAMRE